MGGAYRNFRSANAGLRSDEINRILDTMDTATASAVRGAAAAKLLKVDKGDAAQAVFAGALDQAIKDTVRVDRACRVMTHPAQRSDADPLAELTEVAALYAGWDEERSRLGIPYKLKTLPAITALEPPPKEVADKAKSLNVHGGTIIDAAVTLASGAADWVARSIRT